MAVTDYSGLTINAPQVGIQISKVTDNSADTAHKYAKLAYEQMGYEVIIDMTA